MMDTTPKYIKMCEKAGEIQKEWFPILGDYYYYETGAICIFGCASLMDCRADRKVRLPRQDQLQEMSKLPWEQFDDLCFKLAHDHLERNTGREYCADEMCDYVSKEMAGLITVMHEKYGKAWDDEREGWDCPTNADISDKGKRG